VLLALDLSSVATGFAFGDASYAAPKTGVWKLPGAAEDVFDRTLSVLGESIIALCRVIRAKRVIVEAMIPQMHQGSSAHTQAALAQLTGVACGAGYTATKQAVGRHAVSTVRKHFCGVGFPEKPKYAVMEACRVLGWQVAEHNAGDAAALWSYGMSLLHPKWAPRSTPLFRGAA
jgi:hypothetical protein